MVHKRAALIPVSSLDKAKQRLASRLNSSQRREFSLAMLKDVLQALEQSQQLEQIFLVSNEPILASLQGEYAFTRLPDPGQGLNPAVSAAVEQISKAGFEQLLVLHGDLPCICSADIDELCSRHQHCGVTVSMVSDEDGEGSNALLTSLPPAFGFAYGPGSFAKHCQQLEQKQVHYQRLDIPGLARDMDQPEDLDRLLRSLESVQSFSKQFLEQYE